ncbi:unnamed protein product [Caenorhabditis nigoni]
MHQLFPILLILALLESAQSALRACTPAENDLPGGLWTEWETTAPCPTECGSCSKRFSTRTCLSSSIGKACTGPSTRQILCNTSPCMYPSQRACCVPYVLMVIDGKQQCGPIPKDPSGGATSCCPSGGMVSEWSGFFRDTVTNLFTRTRKCVSEQIGCPCTGSALIQTQSTCPCKDFEDVSSIVRFSHRTYDLQFLVDQSTANCYGYSDLHYDGTVGRPCNDYPTYKTFQAAVIRYVQPNNDTVLNFRVFDCQSTSRTKRVTFYCDLKSEYWRLEGTNEEVRGWNQIDIRSW